MNIKRIQDIFKPIKVNTESLPTSQNDALQ